MLEDRSSSRPGAGPGPEVDIPFEVSDDDTLVRSVSASGGAVAAIEHSGEDAVRQAILAAAAPFRRTDGSYRLENRFRYVVCRKGSS